jgi:anti-sigma B factor antagonist
MRDCIITHQKEGDLDFVFINGSLDSYSFPKMEDALQGLVDQSRHCVILDCAGLEYISSVGLGALIGFTRSARENNGDLKLVNLSDRIYNIIELLGFQKVLEIHAGQDEAVASFAS